MLLSRGDQLRSMSAAFVARRFVTLRRNGTPWAAAVLHGTTLSRTPSRDSCAYVGWIILVLALVNCVGGCRALKSRNGREISQARQLSLRGTDALQDRRYKDAEALFVEALRQSPSDERAQWGLAEVLWTRGELADATKHMGKAVELSNANPELGANPDLLVRLGQMYLDQNNLDLALSQADAALKSHRNNPAAWALKGDVLRRRGELNSSIDCYQRALIYRPYWPEVQVTVAELYRASNRPQRTLATLDRLCDQSSQSQIPPRAFLLRGQALAALGERDAALLCLRQAAPKIPNDQSQLLYEFAQTQYELGDLLEARLCLGRALKQSPQSEPALQLQSMIDQAFARSDPALTVQPVSVPLHPPSMR